MVLHKNKWDKKATRAHVRKLKAQGKEDDTKKPGSGKKEEGVAGARAGTSKQEFPKLPGAEELEVHNDQDSQEDDDEDEDEDGEDGENRGQFSKRKMQNNAWRYEQEEEEIVPGEEPEEPEPEPDYVSMTIRREGQFKGPEEAPKEDLDEEFLKDLQNQRSIGAGAYGESFGMTKGKVVKVDRKQFEDVTTKIAKQSTADAFRQRFAPRKAKSRVGGGGTGVDELDDIDSFLEELKVVEITASRPAGSREISSGLGKSRTSEGYEHDKDDDWLDGVLGGR